VALGGGYAVLSLWFILIGAQRQQVNERALTERRFVGVSRRMITALSAYMVLLIAATGGVLIWGP
jgi:hypothetical protein